MCSQRVSQVQLANTAASSGTLHSEVAGSAHGEGFTTLPSLRASPGERKTNLRAVQSYGSTYVCVVALSLRGGRVHTSRFVLCYDLNTLTVALPSLIGGPHSISAMLQSEGRSVLIFP